MVIGEHCELGWLLTSAGNLALRRMKWVIWSIVIHPPLLMEINKRFNIIEGTFSYVCMRILKHWGIMKKLYLCACKYTLEVVIGLVELIYPNIKIPENGNLFDLNSCKK